MATVMWGAEMAAVYDQTAAEMYEPAVLDPVLDVLAELAGGGAALELAIGTGRVALPLRARGVAVSGIELSPHMVERLRAKPGGADLPVTIGDMTSAQVEGPFDLVYLVFNTIMNVTTQDEQVAVFANAAAHLRPGGCFVVEVAVPELRDRIYEMGPDHVDIDTIDDPVGQITSSHHWWSLDGRLAHHSAPYRYVWPAELDLMARLAGLRRRARWADWHGAPFTADSPSHVSVYERATPTSR